MAYRVKLRNFEGPLDLLLFLIKKNEVDIYDIPIALLTRQYLEYIHLMQKLDLDLASDFILMAARLIRIKVQMLLPKPELEEVLEDFDPRQELIDRLVEYKKYKEIAFDLSRRESFRRLHFVRQFPEAQVVDSANEEQIYGQVSLFDLLAAFNESIKKRENEPIHQVYRPAVSVEDQLKFIKSFLKNLDQVSFTDLLLHVHINTNSALVATFLALLELIRNGSVIVKQASPFSELWIFKPQISN